MGNKLGKRRQAVDDKFTRPQGLYQIKDVDYKKLRKLILESKLAPCYPGGDECDCGLLEECPICFLYYPTLNRSRCCMKSICTECFLQMKNPNSTRPTQCPFCKTANYAVEYRGSKSKEERGLEQIEEQKVIEAKIRMQQQELQKEEEKLSKKEEVSSSRFVPHMETSECSSSAGVESEEVVSFQDPYAAQMLRQTHLRQNMDGEFDLDLEDLMVMEAIWLSIQENGRPRHPSSGDATPEQYTQDRYVSHSQLTPATGTGLGLGSSSSPSGTLACAIAALAERQQMNGESYSDYSSNQITSLDMVASSSRSTSSRAKRIRAKYPPAQPQISSEGFCTNETTTASGDGEDCILDHGSVVAEAGTSYASSDGLNDNDELTAVLLAAAASSDDLNGNDELIAFLPPPAPAPAYVMARSCYGCPDETEGGQGGFNGMEQPHHAMVPCGAEGSFQSVPGPIIPESFEEQMMLAMAVSLAEARARTSAQGVAWQ